MKRVLLFLLVVISLGLCAVSCLQWQRETKLMARIHELADALTAENKKRVQAEQKVHEYGQEIERLEGLRSEIEARLLTMTEELRDRTVDQSSRGFSIAVLMNEAIRSSTELAALKQVAGQGTEAIQKRNAEVSAQNAAIEKANSQIKQLLSERDDAILKLNARTKEFNELVEKYNKR